MIPPDWPRFMTMEAGVHLNEFTQITRRLYPAEDRVTVTVEGANMARLTLYLPRLELLRLRDALAAVARELDGERAALDPGVTDSAA